MLNRTALAAAAALALALPSAAGAMDYVGTTIDQSAPIIKTDSSLLAGDVNREPDYYAVVAGAPVLLTSGMGVDETQQLWRASADGSIAFFRTSDALVPEDTDPDDDLYLRQPAGLSVIAPQAGPIDVVDLTADATRAFLRTKSPLLASDTDQTADVYRYEVATGELTLLTPGTALDVTFHESHEGSGAAVFSTVEAVVPSDLDQQRDVYLGTGSGVPALYSHGDTAHPAHFLAFSVDGRLLYWTAAQHSPADQDAEGDVYSTNGNAGAAELRTPSANAPGAAMAVELLAADRADLHRVVFGTAEKLSAQDNDDLLDFYAHDNGTLTLLTAGAGVDLVFEDASTDAEVMLFSTRDPLLATDTDARMDMYRAGDFGQVHVSKTNGPFDEFSGALSQNGVQTAFQTSEPIANTDTDTFTDVYAVTKGILHLASRRDPAASGGGTSHHAGAIDYLATSELLMETPERLLAEDRNDIEDIYLSKFGELSMVSRDDSAPDTTIDAPAQVLPGETLTVDLRTTEPATLECRLDDGDWVTCAQGWSPGGLATGEHTVQARATDGNGNLDASPAVAVVTAATPAQTVTETVQPPVTPPAAEIPFLPVADAVAPALSAARLRVRRGVPTLTYSLSETAAVRVTLQRRSGGRWKALRTRSLAGAQGANRARLAKLPRRGTFRVTLVAADAAGNASSRLVLRPSRR